MVGEGEESLKKTLAGNLHKVLISSDYKLIRSPKFGWVQNAMIRRRSCVQISIVRLIVRRLMGLDATFFN
jgi:hypothetical protein